jgi:tRNA A37 threonylcarbamoyladenosine modification protein TsaB
MLDARKDDVYLALFRKRDDRLSRLTKDRLMSIEAALDWLRDFCAAEREPMQLLGDGAILHERSLRSALGPRLAIAPARAYPTIAAQVARLGATRLRAGRADDPGALTPIYVQLAHAERRCVN